MATALRAAESALKDQEKSKLSSWFAVDSVPQIKQQPSEIITDSMMGAGLVECVDTGYSR